MFEKIKTHWKIVIGVFVALVILFFISIFILASISNFTYKNVSSITEDSYTTSFNNISADSVSYENSKIDKGQYLVDSAVSEEAGIDLEQKDEKLAYSANLKLETKQLESALEFIYKNIQEHKGIIQQEDQRNYEDTYYVREGYVQQRSSYILVRIPTDSYESFITKIRSSDNVLSVTGLNKSVENFTDVYSDLDIQLKNYKIQQDRLFYFLENAESIEDMLSIESKLSELQYKIESIENNMKSIDKDVEYSKIEINLTEVMKYTDVKENPNTFLERLSLYVSSSINTFIFTMEGILEFSIYAIPYIVIIGLICFTIIKVVKQRKRKKDKPSNTENKEKEE